MDLPVLQWLKDRIFGKVTLHELQQVQEIKEIDAGTMLTRPTKQFSG